MHPPDSTAVAISSSAGSCQVRAMLSIGLVFDRRGESMLFTQAQLRVMKEEGKPV